MACGVARAWCLTAVQRHDRSEKVDKHSRGEAALAGRLRLNLVSVCV